MAYFGQRGPARGGARGGQDRFDWSTVKTDKDREHYLGHSLLAPVGRWQKGKDLAWYTKDKNGKEVGRNAELDAIKKEEQVMMEEMMGIRPRRERAQVMMEKEELREVLKRGTVENDALYHGDTERVEGLGFAPMKELVGMEAPVRLPGSITGEEEKEANTQIEGSGDADVWEQVQQNISPRNGQTAAPRVALDEATAKRLRKEAKRAGKQEKKLAKKQAKKEAKKQAKKESKRADQDDDRRGNHRENRSPPRDRSRDRARDRPRSRDRSRDRPRSPRSSGYGREGRGRDGQRGRRERHDSDSD